MILLIFNRRGAFDNLADSERGLREILEASSLTVTVDVVGSVAFFTGNEPRRRQVAGSPNTRQ